MFDLLRRPGAKKYGTALGKSALSVRPIFESLEKRCLLSVAAPMGITASGVSPSAIELQWNPSPDPTVTGYEVFAKITVVAGGGKGSRGSYTYYNPVATVTGTSDTITGLATGSVHTYVVKAVSPAGVSPNSAAVSAETWAPPSLAFGSEFLLTSGAVYSSPLNVTAGLTTQITLLAGGNPLMYSVQSGPPTVSVDPKSGVVTYTPGLSEVGTVNVAFKISNTLGSVTQSVQFNVVAPNPNQVKPALALTGTDLTYTGLRQGVSATAVGADGTTPVAGTFAFAYNGSNAVPVNAGTYGVLATFTSADPPYGDATVLGTVTISKATPVFSALNSPSVAGFALPGDANLDGKVTFADLVQVARHYGQTGATWATGDFNYDGSLGFDDFVLLARNYGHSAIISAPPAVVSGNIAAGSAIPAGEFVVVTVNGLTQVTTIDAGGNFSTSFPASALPVGTYNVSYSFAGGDPNFSAAVVGASTLTVIPPVAPSVTMNPKQHFTISAGDVVTLSAAATGTPTPTVQWQLSTDGGQTFADILGATSSVYSFVSNLFQNGYLYRAVFTNGAGVATTSTTLLTVQADTGGTD